MSASMIACFNAVYAWSRRLALVASGRSESGAWEVGASVDMPSFRPCNLWYTICQNSKISKPKPNGSFSTRTEEPWT